MTALAHIENKYQTADEGQGATFVSVLARIVKRRKMVTTMWVPGHAQEPWNELVGVLSRQAQE